MRYELLSLKLFVAVCEHGSIARAAEVEHIAASALSKRISDLEKVVKSPLFFRRPHGLDLAPAGETLLQHARGLLRDVTQMELELAEHRSGLRGLVHIYASVSTIVQHLPGDIAAFRRLYPQTRIKIRESVSPIIVRSVAENAADIGIFGGEVPVAGLHTVPYRADRLVVLMSAEHELRQATSLRFREVARYPLVLPKTGTFLNSLITRAAAELTAPLDISIRLHGFESTASMDEAGLGIALVPDGLAARS
ncbi:MAG TPA: LysR substrate-binding domain-containing protein, partial [Alphaproteobacteria bacterium]|nr:LysR substrate-binding domain-containing protein [Alphaproteobacteria bacterium]